VRVMTREPGRQASFQEARPALSLAWSVDKRHFAIATFLSRAFERYDVTIDGSKLTGLRPSARLGRRVDPSAED
jgi:hypothetical protein